MTAMVSPGILTLLGTALVALCGLAGALGASWISKRATDRANERAAALQARTVDREEFDSLTRELRADLNRVRADLDDARSDLDKVRSELNEEHDARIRAEQRAKDADIRASTAAAKARGLERRISQLEEVLRAHDMPVPPPLD